MTLKNTILDFVSANFLIQMTNKPTRHDNALDLTLTTDPDLIAELDTHPGMSDRCAVAFKVNVTVKRHKKLDRHVFLYRKGDFDGAKRDIGEFGARFLSDDPLWQQEPTQGQLSVVHEEKYSSEEDHFQMESTLDDARSQEALS